MIRCKECSEIMECTDDRQEWGTYYCSHCDREKRVYYDELKH